MHNSPSKDFIRRLTVGVHDEFAELHFIPSLNKEPCEGRQSVHIEMKVNSSTPELELSLDDHCQSLNLFKEMHNNENLEEHH